jgi:hypothetical protein
LFASKTPFFSNEASALQVLLIAGVAPGLLRLLWGGRLPPFPPVNPKKPLLINGFFHFQFRI